MEKILLDTDIGNDIDDAICLAYLLAHPECELMGITTVTGQPVTRAELASAMCKVAKKDIPIYPGAGDPILIKQKQPIPTSVDGLERWEHETRFPEGEAVEFMRRTIRNNPGEITLLAIGPLTNVGLLFSVDPEIPRLLKSLVIMCGVFTYQLPNIGPIEWNARCDPHATAIVYRAPAKIHRSVGLDVTFQVAMESAEVKRRFTADLLKPVVDFAGDRFVRKQKFIFHDPLAAATIFDKDVCRFERGNVEVELQGERLQGVTYWSPDSENGVHEVALGVDSERFFNHYFSVVNGFKA